MLPMLASMAWTMWFSYGLDYAFAYACFYDTSMGHCTWYIVPCNELSLWLTVLPLLVGAQLWSLVVSLVLFVLLYAILLFSTCVPLFPFCMLLVFC
jgi:hypothetical protein